jgi:hypothetical protein
MKYISSIIKILLIGFLLLESAGFASDQDLPVIDGEKAVASVNEEPITLKALNRAIASAHASRPQGQKAGRVDYSDIMRRLINTRLIVLEAKNMGLDELPEIQKQIDGYSRQTLMELLLEFHVKDIAVDEKEVQKIYRETVREWQIKTVRFKNEKTAKLIESQLADGADFDQTVQKAVTDGLAEGGREAEYIKDRDLLPPVAKLVATMPTGAVSPVVALGKNKFVIFKLEGQRFPENEDPAARASARREALNRKRIEAAGNYARTLREKYVKLDQKLLDELDFESKEPGFENLLQDQRIIAEIKGETPITVADLTRAIKKKFYHGVKLAIDGKRVNKKKAEIFEDMLQRRVLHKAALAQGLDQTDRYAERVKDYESSVIFGVFVKKAVAPEIKLEIKELQAYYKENPATFASPLMMRIKSLVFRQRQNAVAAIHKLQKGTDFKWLGANADGQVDPNTTGLLKFDGKLLTQTSLPEDVRQAVEGVVAGDFRLYADARGNFYVLHVYQVVSPRQEPFEAVSKEIAEKVYNQKLKKALEFWADQLKEYYPVEIYRAELK